MAYTGKFCTEAEIESKEGANVSADITEAMHNLWAAEVESFINCITRYNWTDAYNSLNSDVKGLLAEAASNLIAIYSIQYDMSGFSSRHEAEDMITILRDRANWAIKSLQDKKVQDFMINA